LKLPGAERAVVEAAKLRDYLLADARPVGRFKAVFFLGLGYSQDEWQTLEADLLRHAVENESQPGESTAYGRSTRCVVLSQVQRAGRPSSSPCGSSSPAKTTPGS
jgi:hypothetical protein